MLEEVAYEGVVVTDRKVLGERWRVEDFSAIYFTWTPFTKGSYRLCINGVYPRHLSREFVVLAGPVDLGCSEVTLEGEKNEFQFGDEQVLRVTLRDEFGNPYTEIERGAGQGEVPKLQFNILSPEDKLIKISSTPGSISVTGVLRETFTIDYDSKVKIMWDVKISYQVLLLGAVAMRGETTSTGLGF